MEIALQVLNMWAPWVELRPYGSNKKLKPVWARIMEDQRRLADQVEHYNFNAVLIYWGNVLQKTLVDAELGDDLAQDLKDLCI